MTDPSGVSPFSPPPLPDAFSSAGCCNNSREPAHTVKPTVTDPSFSTTLTSTRGDDDQEGLEAALMVLDEYISSGPSDDDDECDDNCGDGACLDAPTPRGRQALPRSSSARERCATSRAETPSSPADAVQRRARSKSASTPKKAITWDPNRARNERKGELIFLRKRVSQLEAKLQRLRGKVSASAPSGRTHDMPSLPPQQQQSSSPLLMTAVPPSALTPAAATTTAPSSIESLALWEGISHRQCQERLKSERENIRLKLALERQLKIAKTLDKIVRKKAVIKELERIVQETAGENDAKPTSAVASGASDAALVREAGSASPGFSTLLLLEMHQSMEDLIQEERV